jgi:hypothetical protein
MLDSLTLVGTPAFDPQMYVVNRPVTPAECPWLDEILDKGTILYHFTGATYGCVAGGLAVSRQPNQNPFLEVPRDALDRA